MMKPLTSFEADGRGLTGRPDRDRPCKVTPDDEREFMRAMEDYKRLSGRQFPTWSEILEVLRGLGYAKRIWRPVGPEASRMIGATGPTRGFEPMGEDSDTGVLCWYSRVETPAGV